MEARIRSRFSSRILAETASRYGVTADELHELPGAESFIFEFSRADEPLVLRLGHSLRRNPNLIRGEVDWINFLSAGGARVAKAVDSVHGKLVELIDDGEGGHFLATAFVKAKGQPPPWRDQSIPFLEAYGEAIGRMHRLTKPYEPADPDWQRPHWDDPTMLDAIAFLPDSEAYARETLTALVEQLRGLPRDRDSYGLVHQDAHPMNFFVDDAGTLTFFDFDDCCHSWFVNDIAIVLFYVVTGREAPAAYAEYFLRHFLRGYGRENRFDPHWFAHIPDFLKLREVDLYAVIHRSFDVARIDDPWVARYMDGRKTRIEADLPYVELDVSQLRWE